MVWQRIYLKNVTLGQKGRYKVHTEYKFNKKFRDYVDKYCKTRKISLEEALTHELVRQAYLYYKHLQEENEGGGQ